MKVAVEILTGTLFYIEVGNDATVADLKKEIAAQQKLPQDRLILFLDSKQTRLLSEDQGDGATLVDCGVRDGSHIYLFFDPVDLDESSDHSCLIILAWNRRRCRIGVKKEKEFDSLVCFWSSRWKKILDIIA